MRIPTAIGTGVVSQSIFPPWPRFNERIALIWSDRVNSSKSVGMFFVVALASSRGQSEQQPGQIERRLISLIFAGRNHPLGAASDCYRESG